MSASKQIPYGVRFLITTLEPIFALGGVIMALFTAGNYVHTLTRGQQTWDPSLQFVFTGQAGSWLCFAFTEAIVLRELDDVRAWRFLCAAMLCSDILYCHSIAQALGGWGEWIKVSDWTVEDWTVTITTFPFVISRILIAAGFWGIGKKAYKQA